MFFFKLEDFQNTIYAVIYLVAWFFISLSAIRQIQGKSYNLILLMELNVTLGNLKISK